MVGHSRRAKANDKPLERFGDGDNRIQVLIKICIPWPTGHNLAFKAHVVMDDIPLLTGPEGLCPEKLVLDLF